MACAAVEMSPSHFLQTFFSELPGILRSLNRNRTLSLTPCPDTDYGRYKNATVELNRSRQCQGFRFITIHEKGADASKHKVWAAAWPSKQAPPKDFITSQPTELRLTPAQNLSMDIPVIFHSPKEWLNDPFDRFSCERELHPAAARIWDDILERVQPVFSFQHRTFCYAIVFFGCNARILRLDRSGVIFTRLIHCDSSANELLEFLRRFSLASPTERGVDPTAEYIPRDSALAQRMRARAQLNKDPNDPADYARRLFEESLKEDWPWFKLSVGEGDSAREFLVGAPHYERSHEVLDSGSRGYVALDMGDPDQRVVFMKDMWRATNIGLLREGDTLERLNAKGVPYVPTLLFHGRVAGQTTLSTQIWRQYHGRGPEYGLSAEHYRLVVREVAQRLETFGDSRGLLDAIKCCLIAHTRAMEVPFMHRDISAGNMLIRWDPELRKWQGMLTDWEAATDFSRATYHFGKPKMMLGTNAFAAVRLLGPVRYGVPKREVEDDLEAFFHVLLWYSVRFLESNLQNVPAFLDRYFYEAQMGEGKDGIYRARCVRNGQIRISKLERSNELRFACYPPDAARTRTRPRGCRTYDHPINGVIQKILAWLENRYRWMPLTRDEYDSNDDDDEGRIHTCAEFNAQRMINILDEALGNPAWPVGDKCEDRTPKDYTYKPIEQTHIREILPDDVPLPRPARPAQERPAVELPAAKRKRRS